MLKIKLARFGKKGQPHFRVVVVEARSKRDGQYVKLLGHYIPNEQPKTLEIDLKEYKAWVAKGAQPTETVAALAKRLESGNPFPAKKKKPSKKTVAKEKAAKEAAEAEKSAAQSTVTAPEEASEATATETPTEAAPEAEATPEAPAAK